MSEWKTWTAAHEAELTDGNTQMVCPLVRADIEAFITRRIPELRRALVPKWNALRYIKSKLDPNQLDAPLEFLDDVEPDSFIDFAKDEIPELPFPDPSPDTKSEFQNLIGQLIDDLNGQPWTGNMAMGYAYNYGLRRASISFFESASYISGCWVIDYEAVAEQVMDYPDYKGHTVSEWARLDEGPWIRSGRITAKYTF